MMINMVLRNFFYAVVLVVLAALHGMNPSEAQFGDLVRLVQSDNAQKLVAVATIILLAVEYALGFRIVRSASSFAGKSAQGVSGSASAHPASYMVNNTGRSDYALSLERTNREQAKLIYDLMKVVAQVGELLDHAGVGLERSPYLQESADLKEIGSVLRRMLSEAQILESAEIQKFMEQLGDRYGVEPYGGGPYTLDRLIRIAEEVIERVLPAPTEQQAAAV